ncbi:FAD/NAD(P)-binding protein [Pantoea sp. CCBC3-3-1]|uniref:FAD/NAD(P)-binding protein n=1 Tax=Pantoea sp. CCBC3-3-1 TaxID=2490851 RepID=UPI0011BFACE1|nr:FAD/NAD(P)-binding protein [Pantoea sp. CCBC3-3-1]
MVERHIVIVGGGFTGTALAIHLARLGSAGLTVTVIEPRHQLGQGVAYGTDDPAHRINVPAARMQLSAAQEGEFDQWYRASAACAQDPAARWHDGKIYPQRGQFGAYVAEQFAQAARTSAVSLRHVQDRAVALRHHAIVTASGAVFQADEVVLAISHPPPALPQILQRWLAGEHGQNRAAERTGDAGSASPAALIANPWQKNALATVGADDRIAIIGSGLTMSDVVASLHRQGHRGQIVAFSRRGQLPRDNVSGDYPARPLDYQRPQAATALGWLRRVRQEVARAAEDGVPWQLVLDDIRLNGQRIWQQLPVAEQRRFLRHLRPWWDVHRYRIAPQVSEILNQSQASGRLHVLAARLTAVRSAEQGIQLTLQPRRGVRAAWPEWSEQPGLHVDKLIVTTGPAHGALLNSDALLHQLAEAGEIQADPLALGILVNAHSQAVNQHGFANSHLHVVGPAARGRFGELMGLPQVAEHAETLAYQLLGKTPHPQKSSTDVLKTIPLE